MSKINIYRSKVTFRTFMGCFCQFSEGGNFGKNGYLTLWDAPIIGLQIGMFIGIIPILRSFWSKCGYLTPRDTIYTVTHIVCQLFF